MINPTNKESIAFFGTNSFQSNFRIDKKNLVFTGNFAMSSENFWSEIQAHLSNANWEHLLVEDCLFSKESLCLLRKSQLPILPNELKHFASLTQEQLELIGSPDIPLIHKSVFLNSEFLIERLAQSGAYLSERCNNKAAAQAIFYGHTPLSLALFLDNKSIYELLVKKGADPYNDVIVFCIFTYDWLKNQRPSFLRSLIKSNLLEYEKRFTLNGYSKLHQACERGDLNEVQLLIENGAPFNLKSSKGETPLEICVIFQKNAILEYLLQQGDRPNIGALLKAIAKKNLNAMNSFISHGIQNQNDDFLIKAALLDLPEEIKLFLLQNIKSNSLPQANGISLLHIFVFKDKIDYVTQLLKNGIDPNFCTTTGITPLHLAALRGNKDMAMLLVEYGANINSVDYTNSTPFLQGLTFFKSLNVSQYLASIGAKTTINPFGLYSSLKQLRLKHIRSLLPTSFVFEKVITLRWKEVYLQKICAHVFEIGGDSILTKKNGEKQEEPLILEGLYSPAVFLKDIGSHGSNLLQKKGLKNLAELFGSMCLFTANDSSHSDSEYVKRIQSNQPTLLSVGYWNHGVSLLIWGEYYIECNSQVITICHYKKYNLTPAILNSLRTSRSGSFEDYSKLKITLTNSLNFFRTPIDEHLEKCCNIPDQIVGNCIWKSFESIVYMLFIIYALRGHQASKKKSQSIPKIGASVLKQICTDQKALHSYWLLSTKLNVFNSYLEFHLKNEGNPYNPSANLITNMLNALKGNYPSLNSTLKEPMDEILKKISSLNLPTAPLNNLSTDFFQKFDSLFGHGFLWDKKGPKYKDFYESYSLH